MTSYVPVVKNGASGAIFYVGLVDQANTKLLKASPTIAAGDFKVSIDGGAFANLGTLPAVTPAAGRAVKITLSQAEVNGDNIVVQCVDAAGAEWCDLFVNIQTVARQIDDLAFPATTGRSLLVGADGSTDANVTKLLGTAWLTPGTAGTPDVNVKLWNALATVALPLVPTTAGRTLDVSLTGEAGVDWANVGSPTTANGLTGTTIATSQVVASVTGAVGSVTGAVGSVTARVTANTDQLAGQTVTAAAGVTFPTSVASPTNITAGTITTATNLTTNNDKTGYALSTAGDAAVADKLLGRNLAGGSDGTRTVQDALRLLRNKTSVAAGTLTVTQEDDTTAAWTAVVVTTAGNPISSVDPA